MLYFANNEDSYIPLVPPAAKPSPFKGGFDAFRLPAIEYLLQKKEP